MYIEIETEIKNTNEGKIFIKEYPAIYFDNLIDESIKRINSIKNKNEIIDWVLYCSSFEITLVKQTIEGYLKENKDWQITYDNDEINIKIWNKKYEAKTKKDKNNLFYSGFKKCIEVNFLPKPILEKGIDYIDLSKSYKVSK